MAVCGALVYAAPALAQAVKVPVQALETVCSVLDAGKQWTSTDKILHIRGLKRQNKVQFLAPPTYAGLYAWNTLVVNIDVDPATGHGNTDGTFHIELIGPPPTGFEGRFSGQLTGGIGFGGALVPFVSGRADAQGWGWLLEGSKLSGTINDQVAGDDDRASRCVGAPTSVVDIGTLKVQILAEGTILTPHPPK